MPLSHIAHITSNRITTARAAWSHACDCAPVGHGFDGIQAIDNMMMMMMMRLLQ
jgi:hypothetical protein